MSWFVVDVESDGQIPGPDFYSMVCFGAVRVDEAMKTTFYGKTKPISKKWLPEALAISGFSREQHLTFDEPVDVMSEFANWLAANSIGRPVLISDNNGYDAAFINYYFHAYYGRNPFGFSSRRIGDLYCGMQKDAFAKWKHLRDEPHLHSPVQDALGNVQALIKMKKMGLRIPSQ